MSQATMNQISAIGGGYHGPGAALGGTYSIGPQHEFNQGFDIRITPATGGYIISVMQRNSMNSPELHIVTEDRDLGAEIGKIITMSCLKKDN